MKIASAGQVIIQVEIFFSINHPATLSQFLFQEQILTCTGCFLS